MVDNTMRAAQAAVSRAVAQAVFRLARVPDAGGLAVPVPFSSAASA